MAYATQADVLGAVGAETLLAISDFDGDGVPDSDVIDRALSEASSLADSYLPSPPTSVSDALRRAVVNIAVHNLREPRDKTTEDSRNAFKAAVDWLRDVSAGKASVGAPPVPDSAPEPGDPELEAEARVWTRRTGLGVF